MKKAVGLFVLLISLFSCDMFMDSPSAPSVVEPVVESPELGTIEGYAFLENANSHKE